MILETALASKKFDCIALTALNTLCVVAGQVFKQWAVDLTASFAKALRAFWGGDQVMTSMGSFAVAIATMTSDKDKSPWAAPGKTRRSKARLALR